MVKHTAQWSSIILVLITGISLFIAGCGDEVKEYLLTDEMRNSVPFTGKEKVSFLFDGDTLVMISEFRVNSQYRISCGNHNQGYCLVEINQIWFYGEQHSYRYNMSNGPDFQLTEELMIDWKYGSSYESQANTHFKLPLSDKNLKNSQSFIEKMDVLGKEYTDVYCDSDIWHTGTINYYPTSIYYTKEFGIIRIDFADGRKWELIGIEWK